jgi:uncharacterized membrane protein (DUF106 family)
MIAILDHLFGWLLWLPSDLAILCLALMTVIMMIVTRKWTTNQEWLGRAVADNRQLSQLIREAKRGGDKETLARLRLTKARIGLLKFKQEGKPLLASLVPVALLATWAFARFEFLPPQSGDVVTAIVRAPVSAADDLVHLVPTSGVTAIDGWVKQLTVDGNETTAHWLLRIDDPLDAGQLKVRHAGGPLRLQLQLRERRLFGVVPGWPKIGLPAWLVGYLLIVILLVPILKKLTRIH